MKYMIMRSSFGHKQSIYCVGAYAFAAHLTMYLEQFDQFQTKQYVPLDSVCLKLG